MDNVKNIMETIVEEELEKILSQLDCCHCKECQSDVLALSLNSLPAKYVSTHTGSLYVKAHSMYRQSGADVISAIMRATEIVKQRPRHTVSK